MNKRSNKFINWIVSLSILLGALAPGVSQALSALKGGQGFVVEICSANGSKATQAIVGEESSSPVVMGEHCPYCLIQPIYLLPTVQIYEFIAPQSYGAIKDGVHIVPTLSSAWRTLPSRAPPFQS